MDGTRGGSQRAKTAQVPTGVPGLDRLLNGGLRQGGLHVLLGGPGAGKSVLAHQIGSNLIRAGGTGLGLGITRRLVAILGGEIRARSEPGRGSVFEVELRTERGDR